MPDDTSLLACLECKKVFDVEQIAKFSIIRSFFSTRRKSVDYQKLPIKCECGNEFNLSLPKELHDTFFSLKKKFDNERMREFAKRQSSASGSNTEVIKKEEAPAPKSEDEKITEFQTKIKNIDKNLDVFQRNKQIVDALSIVLGAKNSNIEACLQFVQTEFKLKVQEIEAFRRDFNSLKKEIKLKEEMELYENTIKKLNEPPDEMTEQDKVLALSYLEDRNLIYNISRDITFAGDVVGEDGNKMMLYFVAISRKSKTPISAVIFGKSSSGKSFLANAVEKFIPPEDRITLSSSSARGFEYFGDSLRHKSILIQEWEGLEGVLPTIRTLQSEGKLARLVTLKNPDDGKYKSIPITQECPCSVVVTTTKENIHDENSTRIFELYVDDSIGQTQNVVQNSLKRANIKNRVGEGVREQIFHLHHNIQRLLEPIEVDIPYSGFLSFPSRSTRNRRDNERFLQLIKTIAFLRQKQKEIKFHEGIRYVEADHYDYDIAYRYGIPVISQTLFQISERAKRVLVVCCALMDDFKRSGIQPYFTVNQIQERGPYLNIDLSNRQDLYKQLRALEEYEYIETNQMVKGKTKQYTVVFPYVRDEFGYIININTPEIREIKTPDSLAVAMGQYNLVRSPKVLGY